MSDFQKKGIPTPAPKIRTKKGRAGKTKDD
nr:MAG TPA: hypothetical protein [Caudoviricetes sp.]